MQSPKRVKYTRLGLQSSNDTKIIVLNFGIILTTLCNKKTPIFRTFRKIGVT